MWHSNITAPSLSASGMVMWMTSLDVLLPCLAIATFVMLAVGGNASDVVNDTSAGTHAPGRGLLYSGQQDQHIPTPEL